MKRLIFLFIFFLVFMFNINSVSATGQFLFLNGGDPISSVLIENMGKEHISFDRYFLDDALQSNYIGAGIGVYYQETPGDHTLYVGMGTATGQLTLLPDTWYHFNLDIDWDAQTCSLTVDGIDGSIDWTSFSGALNMYEFNFMGYGAVDNFVASKSGLDNFESYGLGTTPFMGGIIEDGGDASGIPEAPEMSGSASSNFIWAGDSYIPMSDYPTATSGIEIIEFDKYFTPNMGNFNGMNMVMTTGAPICWTYQQYDLDMTIKETVEAGATVTGSIELAEHGWHHIVETINWDTQTATLTVEGGYGSLVWTSFGTGNGGEIVFDNDDGTAIDNYYSSFSGTTNFDGLTVGNRYPVSYAGYVDDGSLSGYPVGVSSPTNNLPSIPQVNIQSDYHSGSRTITWMISTDADSDPITYDVKVGTSSGASDVLSQTGIMSTESNSFNLVPTNTYYYSVRAYDGIGYSDWSTEQSFSFTNQVPYMITNTIAPLIAYTNNDLIASSTTAGDLDGDSVSFTYQWYEDDILMPGQTSDTLTSENTLSTKTYKVEITPTDSFDSGITVVSNDVTVDDPNLFISTWNTSALWTYSGIHHPEDTQSESNQIKLPLESDGNYNFTVYWGDGSNRSITSWDDTDKLHTYVTEGIYTINIEGIIEGFNFGLENDKDKLLDITQWGILKVGNNGEQFRYASNFNVTATDALNLTGTTSLSSMFRNTNSFNGNVGNWDTSNVTSMVQTFAYAPLFNQNISSWNTSRVTTMSGLFISTSFNQPLNSWDISNVENIIFMFMNTPFNQPLDNWNTSSINNLIGTFKGASSFNQDMSMCDTSYVLYMDEMFYGATSFNQPLDSWDTSNVDAGEVKRGFEYMFNGATSFNQSLNTWDTSKITTMSAMFSGASSFNQDISMWDTSNVKSMSSMFSNANSFNQPLNAWNTSNVETIGSMFMNTPFNQPLNNWDTSNVTDIATTFAYTDAFNQDISMWNTSKVTSMTSTFHYATAFNQPLDSWDTSNVKDMYLMFRGATAFNQSLNSWDVSSITFGFFSMFSNATSFNQPINNWDTSNADSFSEMFYGATSFNQDISSWNLSSANTMNNMLTNTIFSTENYDKLLISLSEMPSIKNGIILGAAPTKYTGASINERAILTDTYSWSITDGGYDAPPNIIFLNPIIDIVIFSVNWIYETIIATDIEGIDQIILFLYNSTYDLINMTNSFVSPTSYNFTGLDDGVYYLNATVNDTVGNINQTRTKTITIDTTPPIIVVNSPTNTNYHTKDIQLNIDAQDSTSPITECLYSLDGNIDTQIPKDTGTIYSKLLFDLDTGPHNIIFTCTNAVTLSTTTATINFNITFGEVTITLVSSGFLPDLNQDDNYIASELPQGTVAGLVHADGDFKEVSVDNGMALTNSIGSRTYLVYTEGTTNDIKDRTEHIRSGEFDKMPNPSFGFPITDKYRIYLGLEYNLIDFNVKDHLNGGIYEFEFKNTGMRGDKLSIEIKR